MSTNDSRASTGDEGNIRKRFRSTDVGMNQLTDGGVSTSLLHFF